MKFFAIFLILFASSSFAYLKGKGEDLSISVSFELYSFIEVIGRDISCFLTPISSICDAYSSPLLKRLDFFDNVKASGVEAAYLSLQKRVSLPPRAHEIFKSFFSKVGRGYLRDELELIKGTLSELAPILSAEKERVKKEKTLTLTLSSAFSVGLVILLI